MGDLELDVTLEAPHKNMAIAGRAMMPTAILGSPNRAYSPKSAILKVRIALWNILHWYQQQAMHERHD